MLGLGRFLSSLRDMYQEVNPATLTGAVDVIVVEQEDGLCVCSPFYVRFGKMGVLTSREKVVDITINEEPVSLHMRLNQLGDAYFVEDPGEDREVVYSKPDWSAYNWANEKYAKKSDEVDAVLEAAAEKISEPISADTALKGIFGELSLYIREGSAAGVKEGSEEVFQAREISFEQFNANPDIIFSPDIVVKWSGKYYKHYVAVPVLLSLLLYQRPLSDETINRLMEKYHGNSNPSIASPLTIDPYPDDQLLISQSELSPPSPASSTVPPMDPTQAKKVPTTAPYSSSYNVTSWFSWRRGASIEPSDGPKSNGTAVSNESELASASPPQYSSNECLNTPPLSEELNDYNDRGSLSPNHCDRGALSDSEIDRSYKRQASIRSKRTLHLNSDQLKKLHLKPGIANHATFSVTTKYQGTSVCECDIYLWCWRDKIVISDIDGTITKSDVLGHILPIVGWQWEHLNVVELFGKIMDNGYKFIYLTARAIGQSHQTKDYLKSIKQSGKNLPEGPLLLSPTSLFMALHREIIEKKPEIFKTKCLRDVRALFPESSIAFYAGFGNKATDEIAYRAAGIPCNRIFTINAQGEVRLAVRDLKSSYQHILDLVDQIFPPICHANPLIRFASPVTAEKSDESEPADSAATLHVENLASVKSTGLHFGVNFTFPEEYSTYSYWRQISDAAEVDLSKFPRPEKTGRKSSRKTISLAKKAK